MAFETVRRFLDGVYYNQDDMANSFNGVFGNLNNITANVSGLNVVLSGGYVLLNGYFINFVGVDTVAVTANASGYIYVSYDFSDDTYSISYAATIPADSDTVKNLGIYSTVSTASAVTLTKINNNDSMFAIINSAIAKINTDISTINTNLDYKFDLGIRGSSTKNTQNSAGSISLDGTNMNNIHYTGFYYCISCVNAPVAGNGFLVVESITTNNIQQTYTVKKETTSTNIPVYQRQCVSGTWTAWKLFSGSVTLFGNGTSSTGAEGSTINIALEEIKKYGRLRIILFHPSDTSYKVTVDMPIDGLLTSGDKRGAGNVMSTATTTALSTAWTVLTFSTNSIAINVCKYMGFAGGTTPGNPGTLYIRSIEGLPA